MDLAMATKIAVDLLSSEIDRVLENGVNCENYFNELTEARNILFDMLPLELQKTSKEV